jgi:alkylation response protein AidB-like acyl-CoA dehydrogenase
MTLDDERGAIVAAIRAFAARECGTREQRDALTDGGRETHNAELYARLAALGWLGVGLPGAYGGGGGGTVDACLLLEELARGMVPAFGLLTTLIVGAAVERCGSEQQRSEVLGSICAGSVKSIAMSEPDAGSDVAAMRCRAVAADGGFVIDGHKTWISNAHIADEILLVCRTSLGERRHDGLSMLRVAVPSPGLTVRAIDTLGGREVNDVFFDGVFVPAEALVGVEGHGWRQLMAGLDFERTIIAASILGTAQRAFDDTLDYVRARRQFGRPIGAFQALGHRIADLATELRCCRLLVYDVARRADEAGAGVSLAREASMAKLKVTETAKRVALEGMQMMGGYGYATEYDMAQHLRAVIASTVYGGTSEIQREIVARSYGLSAAA